MNSAAASSQISKRDVWYAPPYYVQVPQEKKEDQAETSEPPAMPAIPVYERNAPLYEHQETSTVLGEHQDAAGILKAAKQIPLIIWAGIAGIIIGVLGALHAHENEKSGYPLVWVMTGGIGAFLIMLSASGELGNGWLFLYAAPLLFYVAQKFGLLKLPGLP